MVKALKFISYIAIVTVTFNNQQLSIKKNEFPYPGNECSVCNLTFRMLQTQNPRDLTQVIKAEIVSVLKYCVSIT